MQASIKHNRTGVNCYDERRPFIPPISREYQVYNQHGWWLLKVDPKLGGYHKKTRLLAFHTVQVRIRCRPPRRNEEASRRCAVLPSDDRRRLYTSRLWLGETCDWYNWNWRTNSYHRHLLQKSLIAERSVTLTGNITYMRRSNDA